MSRAFVKDDDGGEGVEDLPDRLISDHPNLVTVEGAAQIEAEVERWTAARAAAQTAADRNAIQKAARELRYWSARQASATVMPVPEGVREIQFGTKVTIERSDGRRQTWRITGEDEADPKAGSVSYVSPLAQALLGKTVGDVIRAGASDAEIIRIDV